MKVIAKPSQPFIVPLLTSRNRFAPFNLTSIIIWVSLG